MGHDFRILAKQALARAEAHMASGAQEHLRYAALELRMCIEALTYDRAQGYVEVMPLEVIKTWQPQKLMKALIEIEPLTNEAPTVHFLDESLPEPSWVLLGEETIFSLQSIEEHIHALGSYVHYPSLEQAAKGPNFQKMRRRCVDIAEHLNKVLASPVFNPVVLNVVEIPCDECGGTVLKHMPHKVSESVAQCFGCKAEYRIFTNDDGSYDSHRLGKNAPCPQKDCEGVMPIPREKIKDGHEVTCPLCKSKYLLQSTFRLLLIE